MKSNKEILRELMLEVEAENPLDFADLPFDDDDLRDLAAERIADMGERLTADGAGEGERMGGLLALVGHLLLENILLNARLIMKAGGPPPDAEDLLREMRGR